MKSQLRHIPFGKQVVGSLGLMFIGFNYTKRYMTFPHHGADASKPITLPNGELQPYEKQPPVVSCKLSFYRVLLILIRCTISILSDEKLALSLLTLTLFNSSINAQINKLKMKLKLSLLSLLTCFSSISALKQATQFCQFNADCASSCCYQQKCQDQQTCSIMAQVQSFEKKNYCKLDLDCDGGFSQCCFEQKCVPSGTCVVEYYVPLIVGIVIALMIGFASTFIINIFLKRQAEQIKQELRRKQIRQARKKKKDQQKLLGEEANNMQIDHDNPYLEPQPIYYKEEPPADIDDFLNGQPPQVKPFQFPPNMNPQQILFMQQMMLAHQMKIQEAQASQMLQPGNIQMNRSIPSSAGSQINRSQALALPVTPPFEQNPSRSRMQEMAAKNRTPHIRESQASNNEIAQNNAPAFFGKPNPFQNMIDAKNPMYADYKPNVPNSGKIEQNMMDDANFDADLNNKRSILKDIRGPISSHLANVYNAKEGPLPNEVNRF